MAGVEITDRFVRRTLDNGRIEEVTWLELTEVRIITTAHDLWIMAISLAPLLTGFVAAHQAGEHNGWLLAHIITGEIWLIAVPFTKLSHAVLFFCSRAQIGIDFGTKRGGQRGSGIVW